MANTHTLSINKDLVAIGCLDGVVKVFSLSSNACVCKLIGHSTSIACLCFFGNGMIASGCNEPLISFWNIGRQTRERLYRQHRLRISGMTRTANDELLASASIDGSISTYNCRSMALVNTWFLPDKVPISCIRDHINERLLFALTWARSIYVYEPYDGECRQKWDIPWLLQVGSLSSDGYFLGLTGNETITTYDFRSMKDVSYPLSMNQISSFSDDASLLSLGYKDGSISVHSKDTVDVERVSIQNGYIEHVSASATGVSFAYSNGLVGYIKKFGPEYNKDGPHETMKQKPTNIIDLYQADEVTTALYKPGRLILVWYPHLYDYNEKRVITIRNNKVSACQVAHSFIKCENKVVIFIRNQRNVGVMKATRSHNFASTLDIYEIPSNIHCSEKDDVEYFRLGKTVFDDKFVYVAVATKYSGLFIYKANVVDFDIILSDKLPGIFDDVTLVNEKDKTLTIATICKNETNPAVSLWRMVDNRCQISKEISLSTDPPVALIDNLVILQSGIIQKYQYTAESHILLWQFKMDPGDKYAYSPCTDACLTEREECLYILRKGKCVACNLPPLRKVLPKVSTHSSSISAVGLTSDQKHLISCSSDGLLISTKLDSWNDKEGNIKTAQVPINVDVNVVSNNLHCVILFPSGKLSTWQKPLNVSRSEWKLQKTYNLPFSDNVLLYPRTMYESVMFITKKGYLFRLETNGSWTIINDSGPPIFGLYAVTRDDYFLTVQTSTSHPHNCDRNSDEIDGWSVKSKLVNKYNKLQICFEEYIARFIISPDGKVGAALSANLREIEYFRVKKAKTSDENGSDCKGSDFDSQDDIIQEEKSSTTKKQRINEKYDHLKQITLEDVGNSNNIGPIKILNEHCICMANVNKKDIILLGDCRGRLIELEINEGDKNECRVISQSHTRAVTCVGFTQKSQIAWTGSEDFTVKCKQLPCSEVGSKYDTQSYLVPSPPLFITTCLFETDEVIVTCANGDVFPL